MQKKDLFIGMGIGAVIALGGMMLGGMAQLKGLKDGDFRVLTAREFHLKNVIGDTLIEMSARGPQPAIVLRDNRGMELVRISSVLKGGGTVTLRERGVPMITLNSVPGGGIFTVYRNNEGAPNGGVRIAANKDGGNVIIYDKEGAIFHSMPPQPQ